MGSNEDKLKRQIRRKNHIAKDLRTRKFAPKVVKGDIYDRNKLKKIEVEFEYNEEE